MAKNAILLAGGNGTRLAPFTKIFNKHMLGVNEKFIIDYPLNTLRQMGIENTTIIMGGEHFSQVVDHCQDGRNHGMNFNYVFQGEAKGIAHAINLCKRYVQDSSDFTVLLGDNFFENSIQWNNPDYLTNPRAQIILANHSDLQRFGVASLDGHGKIIKIEEKPQKLNSHLTNLAIAGCYLFTLEYFEFFKELKPSARGEYEISEIIQKYLDKNNLTYAVHNGKWSDMGTHQSIAAVNNYLYFKGNI